MKITGIEALILFSESRHTRRQGLESTPSLAGCPQGAVLTDRYRNGRHQGNSRSTWQVTPTWITLWHRA